MSRYWIISISLPFQGAKSITNQLSVCGDRKEPIPAADLRVRECARAGDERAFAAARPQTAARPDTAFKAAVFSCPAHFGECLRAGRSHAHSGLLGRGAYPRSDAFLGPPRAGRPSARAAAPGNGDRSSPVETGGSPPRGRPPRRRRKGQKKYPEGKRLDKKKKQSKIAIDI